MGFDRHFQQDHCYLDDPTNDVGMNVEIVEDNSNLIVSNVVAEKPTIRYYVNSFGKPIPMSSQSTVRCEPQKMASTLQKKVSRTGYCTKHEDLFLYEDEKLVKPGDKFATHGDFIQYLNENAKRWYFYYKCSDSRFPNTINEFYIYTCVYLRNKDNYKKQGLRKRNNNMKTDCPCKIKLRHINNERELTVVYVCHHHDHELSYEQFCKLQHGRRLPPYIKEEIRDFLALQVDKRKIRKYVEMETGVSMTRSIFYTLERNLLRTKNRERNISADRLKMLNEKIAAVDQLYGNSDDEELQRAEKSIDDSETPHRPKTSRVQKDTEHIGQFSQVKRRSNATAEASKVDTKRIKTEPKSDQVEEITYNDIVKYNEILQSVKNMHESVEIQKNPWVPDQCVPALTNSMKTEYVNDENVTYQLAFYNPETNTQEIISTNINEIINNANNQENGNKDEIQYETLVVRSGVKNETQDYIEYQIADDEIIQNGDFAAIVANDDDEAQETEEYTEYDDIPMQNGEYETIVNNDGSANETQTETDYQVANETVEQNTEYETVTTDETHNANETEEYTEYLDDTELQNGDTETTVNDISQESFSVQEALEGDEVQYVTEDNEQLVQYITEGGDDNAAHDVGVQTSKNTDKTLLPVFDVYMKDGNVTGFIVNDSIINGTKECEEKGVQTSEDLIDDDIDEVETEDSRIYMEKSGDTYTKHEYIHKYNLEHYMTQSYFPRYVEILAKETDTDVLEMFTNIYSEKAMFKLTTTQKGKEGNTRIRYITHNGKIKKKRAEDNRRDKHGKNLQSIFILKEKMRMIKKHNKELLTRNNYLEDVVMKLEALNAQQ